MKNSENEVSRGLKRLYAAAEAEGGIQYLYTLVRVTGLTAGVPDPLVEVRALLEGLPADVPDDQLRAHYASLASEREPLRLVANLIACAKGGPYDPAPFLHLQSGRFPNVVESTASQVAQHLVTVAREADMPDLAELLDKGYPEDVLDSLVAERWVGEVEAVCTALGEAYSFLHVLLGIYFAERLKYKDLPRVHKLPRFEVLELLVNDEYGLYGFRVHFSNGASACFARHPDSTECTNVQLGTPIGFFAGDLDEPRDEWRIGAKRLYEVGLPGRYNALGEWKPIVYPGNPRPLIDEALSLSHHSDVQGAFFYMACTGHRVIEFVVRTTIDLPLESVTFGDRLHLWKCPLPNAAPPPGLNVRVYDGWLALDSVDPDAIRNAIASIGVAANRLAFAYDAAVDWRVKYSVVQELGGYATPSQEDLQLLDSMLRDFPRAEDSIYLDIAIDWYNRGRSSRNVFWSFLCYYITVESLALAVADGKAELGLGCPRPTKSQRRKRAVQCIARKHDELYEDHPVKFVQEAYSECVRSLTQKTRTVTELVFGPCHDHVRALFERQDGHSLCDIRGKLAHGSATMLHALDEGLVKQRLGDMAEVARGFLTRVIFGLKPTDPLPTWSGLHQSSTSMADPRATLVVSREDMIANGDWRIRPEWCD